MTPDRTKVVFVAGKHVFAGAVVHGSFRLLDVLNDCHSEMLKVYDVDVFRQNTQPRFGEIEAAIVPKSMIDCVLLCGDTHEAPLRRQYAMIEKKPRAVLILMRDHAIRGSLMLKGSGDASQVLMNDASAFFPIISPELSWVGAKNDILPAQVALVNKTKVSLIQTEHRSLKPSANSADASATNPHWLARRQQRTGVNSVST